MDNLEKNHKEEEVGKKPKWKINIKYWLALEATTLVIVVILVWGLFSLPAVFYLGRPADVKNQGSCQLYTSYSSFCYPFLTQSASCIPSLINRSGLYIAPSVDLQQSESTASQIQSFQDFLSPQCKEVALPFLCLYLFPLCDDNQTTYLPSMAQCISISTDICRTEWLLASSLVNNLPVCSKLPNVSPCNGSTTPASTTTASPNNASTTNSTSLSVVNKTCSENFIFNGNYCLPDCPKWSLRASGTNADYVVIVAAVVGLISGTIVLLLSCVRHRRMFAFPSILVVYQTIMTILLALFAVISFIDPKGLYCTEPDWIGSLKRTTPFCAISGSVLFFCLMELAVLWIFHVAVIFWNVIFPLQVMDFNSRHWMKYIHALIVCVALLIPATTVAVVFGTGGFVSGTFPPLLCVSKSSEAAFYALVLPISIIIPSGVTLLLVVFWNVHKQHIIQREQRSKSPIRLGTAEKKVLIVFIYYVLLGIIALAAFGINVRTGNAFAIALVAYFACESTMPGNCEASRNKALNNTFPGLTDTAYILLALFPLVNLVYAFNFNELKDILYERFKMKWPTSRRDTLESTLEKSQTTAL
eukprot:Em0005g1255a